MKMNTFSTGQISALLVGALVVALGCSTLPPQPAMDISGPDWVVREGRVTRRGHGSDATVAGKLLVAMHWDGRSSVQFVADTGGSAIAQSTTNSWQAQDLGSKKVVAGRGKLPESSVWLQLPDGLLGNSAIETDWIMNRERGKPWKFHNDSTGESLEGTLKTTRMPALHRVQPGEHIIRVVRRYGITIEALRAANPGRDLDWFRVGNEINLPGLTPQTELEP